MGGFNVRVNCPHCDQEMNPANLVKHQEPCLNSRGRFLNGTEVSEKLREHGDGEIHVDACFVVMDKQRNELDEQR